jgi:hypothetical protein
MDLKIDLIKKWLLDKDSFKTLKVLDEEVQKSVDKKQSMESDAVMVNDEDTGISIDSFNLLIKEISGVSDVVLGKDVLNDIEMIKSYNNNSSDTVVKSIDNTILIGSKHYFKKLLMTPIFDCSVLESRILVLNRIGCIASENPSINSNLKLMVQYEKDLIWLYQCQDDELSSLYDMVYFRYWFLKHLNGQDVALTCHNLYRILVSPVIGIISPITYFVIPYLVLRFKFKLDISFMEYVKLTFTSLFAKNGLMNALSPNISKFKYVSYAFSFLFYFQSLFNSVEIAKASHKVSRIITTRINNIVKFIQLGKHTLSLAWDKDIACFFPGSDQDAMETLDCFDGMALKPYFLLSNFGKQLKIFKQFKKTRYLPLINKCYMLDSLLSIVTTKDKMGFCVPIFEPYKEGPCLNIQGVWHPCLDHTLVVKNSVEMNSLGTRNIMLTGPNAGGKSTLIKSVMISVILAQTLCIANADCLHITPFKYINSQIHIPDCKGKESLFEAEMYRSKSNFEELAKLDNLPSFIVMDEIFNSTNPIEGIAGAYAIAKSLAKHESNIAIISTHYIYLTRLARETLLFTNYKMNVEIEDGGIIQYPYSMSKGVSRQYIALELLKKNGFNPDIIEEGMRIKELLLQPHKTTKQKVKVV